MRHRIGGLAHRFAQWLDHSHCPFCGSDDQMCCIEKPVPEADCYTCEQKFGLCWRCKGSGTEVANVERDGTIYVITCLECNGTGRK